MDPKLHKTVCPPGDYLIFRQGHAWYVTVLSDGTIFIKLDQKVRENISSFQIAKSKILNPILGIGLVGIGSSIKLFDVLNPMLKGL